VTRIEWDGTMQRRMVDTAQRDDGPQWEALVTRALAILPPYTAVPRTLIYHVSVDDYAILAAEHNLTGSQLDLITAVLAMGDAVLALLRTARAAQYSDGTWRTCRMISWFRGDGLRLVHIRWPGGAAGRLPHQPHGEVAPDRPDAQRQHLAFLFAGATCAGVATQAPSSTVLERAHRTIDRRPLRGQRHRHRPGRPGWWRGRRPRLRCQIASSPCGRPARPGTGPPRWSR
jgi:hypothetical protein